MTFGNNTYKGFFKPQNPLKYKGDPSNIVFRSSWELRVMKYFDEHPSVIWWASEELPIKYLNPIDKRYHRYFPDFIVKMQQKDNKVMTYVLEVKPYDQTQQPKQRRKTQKYLQESATYVINQSKWQAADIFCKEHGWIFKVITERDLNL